MRPYSSVTYHTCRFLLSGLSFQIDGFSDVHMFQGTLSTFVWFMVCHQLSAKATPGSLLKHNQLDNSNNFNEVSPQWIKCLSYYFSECRLSCWALHQIMTYNWSTFYHRYNVRIEIDTMSPAKYHLFRIDLSVLMTHWCRDGVYLCRWTCGSNG